MSSDLFRIRVRSVEGGEVVFDALTGTAGGPDDYADSRSFILLLLWNLLDEVPESANAPLREALAAATASNEDWYVDEGWMEENVGRFVESSELVERRNNLGEEELRRRERAISDQVGGALDVNKADVWRPLRWQQCHNFTLRATLTDPAWAAHLRQGQEFGTTAYDVWEG